jgi:hypothetical protein
MRIYASPADLVACDAKSRWPLMIALVIALAPPIPTISRRCPASFMQSISASILHAGDYRRCCAETYVAPRRARIVKTDEDYGYVDLADGKHRGRSDRDKRESKRSRADRPRIWERSVR